MKTSLLAVSSLSVGRGFSMLIVGLVAGACEGPVPFGSPPAVGTLASAASGAHGAYLASDPTPAPRGELAPEERERPELEPPATGAAGAPTVEAEPEPEPSGVTL